MSSAMVERRVAIDPQISLAANRSGAYEHAPAGTGAGENTPLHCGSRGGPSCDRHWYVARTHFRQEFLALDHLSRQRFRSHLPLFAHRSEKRGTTLRVLFPRYLFVELDIRRDAWGAVLSTIGIETLLHDAGGRPCSVPGGVVEDLMARGRPGDGVIDDRRPPPQLAGTEVRLLSGPFENFTGLCRKSDSERVEVLLDIFGRSTPVEIRRGDVEPVR